MGCLGFDPSNISCLKKIANADISTHEASVACTLSNDANLQEIAFGNCEEAFLDITLDNQKLSPPLIEKIKKYNEAMKFASGGEMIGTGAMCKNPCYEYRGDSTTTCPKCSSSVTEDYENGYKIQIKYIEYKRRNEEVKVYDDNVCKSINFMVKFRLVNMIWNNYVLILKKMMKQRNILILLM